MSSGESSFQKSMNIRFIDRNGKEQVASGLAEFIAAVRDGELSSDTLVFDAAELRWKKASETAELRAAASGPEMPVAKAELSPILEDSVRVTTLLESPSEMPSGAATVGAVDENDVGQAQSETSDASVPISEGTGQRSTFLEWARNASGPTLYGITLGLGSALVKGIAPLVRDEYVSLAITVMGATGGIMAINGFFRHRKSPSRLDFLIAALVLLSIPTSFGAIMLSKQKAKETVERTHVRLSELKTNLDAQVMASKMTDVFEMLSGKQPFEIATVVETRSHMDELTTLLAKTAASTEAYLTECRADLLDTDPNLVYLNTLSQNMKQAFWLKRDYFAEIGRLLDFLISRKGTYSIASQGIRFQKQEDSTAFNTSLDRIAKYEEQMAAIASRMTAPTNADR
jgi:hypothetical protein